MKLQFRTPHGEILHMLLIESVTKNRTNTKMYAILHNIYFSSIPDYINWQLCQANWTICQYNLADFQKKGDQLVQLTELFTYMIFRLGSILRFSSTSDTMNNSTIMSAV